MVDRVYCEHKERKTIGYYGGSDRAEVVAEIHGLGQEPYFAITAHGNDFGGCLHDMIREEWPHLARYIRWHLTRVSKGPTHYVANALYWAGHSGWCDGKPGSPPNEEHLKSTIVYGTVDGDEDVDPMSLSKEELMSWLNGRFDRLMQAFDEDMRSLFGEQYRLKGDADGRDAAGGIK